MRSDIWKQVLQLAIVIISGICAYFFPLTSKFLNIDSIKVLTSLDISIFSTILNILWIFIDQSLKKRRMNVQIMVKSERQNSSELYITKDDVAQSQFFDILVTINVKGKKRKCKEKVIIKCPNSYILQLKKSKCYHFVTESKNSEEYEINLNQLLSKCPENDISFCRNFQFSLVLEEHSVGNVDELRFEKEKKYGWINLKSEGLKLVQK